MFMNAPWICVNICALRDIHAAWKNWGKNHLYIGVFHVWIVTQKSVCGCNTFPTRTYIYTTKQSISTCFEAQVLEITKLDWIPITLEYLP